MQFKCFLFDKLSFLPERNYLIRSGICKYVCLSVVCNVLAP